MFADDNLSALAAEGGTAVADAMTTGTWPAARNRIIRLFSLHGLHRPAVTRAQLDGRAALMELASQRDLARKGLASLWELELALLLKENPAAEAESRQLVTEIGTLLTRERHRRCAGWPGRIRPGLPADSILCLNTFVKQERRSGWGRRHAHRRAG